MSDIEAICLIITLLCIKEIIKAFKDSIISGLVMLSCFGIIPFIAAKGLYHLIIRIFLPNYY